MELGDAEDIRAKFSELAEEVNSILKKIREREAEDKLRRKREAYSAPRPTNIYKELPGRPDFEYIKVPKKPSELSFGTKTDRTVFPYVTGSVANNEPGVTIKNETCVVIKGGSGVATKNEPLLKAHSKHPKKIRFDSCCYQDNRKGTGTNVISQPM